MRTDHLEKLRNGEELTLREQIALVLRLSVPAILANAASTVMSWIDSAMVGRLGANGSAAVGLVMTCIWLVHGLCMSGAVGFTVMVAQRIGAKDEHGARNLLKEGFAVCTLASIALGTVCVAFSRQVPVWLGGAPEIIDDAASYFFIVTVGLPVVQIGAMSEGMLRASGNMRTPSLIFSLMCLMDVVFNALLIFPSHTLFGITVPGAGLGVRGAALGTFLANIVGGILFLYALFVRSPALRLRKGEGIRWDRAEVLRCVRISVPNAIERLVMGGAQVAFIAIIAPLGPVSLAANQLATSAEALCYMPGYGIEHAAATMIGQSIGARRKDMAVRLGWVAIALGTAVMTVTAAVGFLFATPIMRLLTVDPTVIALGAEVLRIEMLAEPLFAVSIVCAGVFQGAGDTLSVTLLDVGSIWFVRISMMLLLTKRMGLRGAWIAMAAELCVRGTLFLIRMIRGRWLRKV